MSGRLKNIAVNLLLLIVFSAAALIILDWAIALIYKPEVYKISIDKDDVASFVTHDPSDIRKNVKFLRYTGYSEEKGDGVYRIACVGDSVIYGENCPPRFTIPKQLEAILNRNGGRFEVINFGVPGFNAIQVAEFLRLEVMRYDPDLIIYGYCLNDDMYGKLPAFTGVGDGAPRSHKENIEKLVSSGSLDLRGKSSFARAVYCSNLFVFSHSKLQGLLNNEGVRKALRKFTGRFDGYFDYTDRLKSLYDNQESVTQVAFKEIRIIADYHDKKVVIALFPSLHYYDLKGFNPYAAICGKVKMHAGINRFSLVDLVGHFRGIYEGGDLCRHFADRWHFSEIGTQVCARIISEHLESAGLISLPLQ